MIGRKVTTPQTQALHSMMLTVWNRLFRNSNFQLAAVVRATPLSMLGHIVNVTIALIAFQSSVPWGPLALWAGASYAVAAWVFCRWATRARRKRRADASSSAPSALATRKAIIFGAVLAAPWGLLGLWLLGQLPQQQELILIALCLGMSASGSVLLSATYPAAIAYMASILTPVAIKCFLLLEGHEYLLLGALTVSYAVFLLNCINSCARLFADKNRAVEELSKSLIAAEDARREIEHAALHDALTGLPNRRAFLGHSLAPSEDGIAHGALFYIDLDRFKPTNDTFGHNIGDKLLQAVGARLRACMREGDFIARLGGDEFTLLANDIGDQTEAETRAATILDAIWRPYSIEGHLVTVGASIGISLADRDVLDTAQLLKMADLALYKAKNSIDRRYCCYQSSMLMKVEARQNIEKSLRFGVANNQLELHYQPIVELKSLRLIGAEALIRWRHPQRGLILPGEFLQLAEEMQLLHTIEAWVLKEACRQATLWPEHFCIAVNVSPSQVAHTKIVDTVADILSATGLQPGRLELEVTESAILNNDSETRRKLHALKALGVRLVMDDFGTGYSSLVYLSRFPFDHIKIDRTFVDGLLKDSGSASIVRATTDMARSLGLRTTAEGVETDLQLNKLKTIGIELGQGHLFSSPLPADELPALFLRGVSFNPPVSTVATELLCHSA
jgi:diguanylate cyclase (GGDEF)-like protein